MQGNEIVMGLVLESAASVGTLPRLETNSGQDRSHERSFESTNRIFSDSAEYEGSHKQAAQRRWQQGNEQNSLLVLLITSGNQQRDRLERALRQGGYRIMTAASGREAMKVLHSWGNFSMVMVHRLLDMPPVQFCEDLRASDGSHADVPIILVAEHFDADQAVDCLRAGANDYISGPHLDETRVLLARLSAVMRTRQNRLNAVQGESDRLITVGSIVIDPVKLRVFVDDNAVELTKIQFHLLCTLARRPGRVFPHVELRAEIAEHGGNPDERSVKSHIFHLRKRLGSVGNYVQTVRGLGYMLTECDHFS
jgi:two-component system phosphate regulon response regulator PhoB